MTQASTLIANLGHDVTVGHFVQLKEPSKDSTGYVDLHKGQEGMVVSIDATDKTALIRIRMQGRMSHMYVHVPLQKLCAS